MSSKSPSPRPLSVKVLSLYFLALGFFVGFIQIRHMRFQGIPISAFMHHTVEGALWISVIIAHIIVAIGLWRLNNLTRLIAIFMQGCWVLFISYLCIIYLPSGLPQNATGTFTLLGLIISPPLSIWFLIKRKSAFTKEAQTKVGRV